MRLSHDAVMVGGGTARADDPSLTVRGFGKVPQPVRIVASRLLDVPLMSTLAQTARDVPVWLAHGKEASSDRRKAWKQAGAELVHCDSQYGQLDPVSLMSSLGARGLTRVFCEGGGALAASLLQADLVDELVGFTAGLAIGAEGQPAIGALGLSKLDEAPRFALIETRAIGGDILHRWQRQGTQL
jgi:diaminohydroxyphosphoribosylaminopyrimidine deaminase/5-amino-6-(5-phosphoribosylamino)uracil reductase